MLCKHNKKSLIKFDSSVWWLVSKSWVLLVPFTLFYLFMSENSILVLAPCSLGFFRFKIYAFKISNFNPKSTHPWRENWNPFPFSILYIYRRYAFTLRRTCWRKLLDNNTQFPLESFSELTFFPFNAFFHPFSRILALIHILVGYNGKFKDF